MKLQNNQSAPDFSIADIYGNTIKLSDFKGKKIHLGFFRNVNCPFCNLRVHQLSKMNDTFKQNNLQSIYFFESQPRLLLKSIFHKEISPIPLIGDPERKIYSMYGIETSMFKMMSTFFSKGMMKDMKAGDALNVSKVKDDEATQTLIPADFLVDEQLNIHKAYYGNRVNDHIAIEDIKTFVGI